MEVTIRQKVKNKALYRYQSLFNQIAKRTLLHLQEQGNALTVLFLSDAPMQALNLRYRNLDQTTDVLSFASREGEQSLDEGYLGDILINIDAAARQAEAYGHSEKREIAFLFTHGLLHLLGYDHQNEAESKVMEALQREILDDLVARA